MRNLDHPVAQRFEFLGQRERRRASAAVTRGTAFEACDLLHRQERTLMGFVHSLAACRSQGATGARHADSASPKTAACSSSTSRVTAVTELRDPALQPFNALQHRYRKGSTVKMTQNQSGTPGGAAGTDCYLHRVVVRDSGGEAQGKVGTGGGRAGLGWASLGLDSHRLGLRWAFAGPSLGLRSASSRPSAGPRAGLDGMGKPRNRKPVIRRWPLFQRRRQRPALARPRSRSRQEPHGRDRRRLVERPAGGRCERGRARAA